VVEPGVTGYLTAREEELAALVLPATKLERMLIRQRVAVRFDLSVVAGNYLRLYEQIVAGA